MSIKTILFDLDGTLLPMDQDEFTKAYFKLLAKKAAPHGYQPEQLINAVWAGTAAMVKNDGTRSNEEAFWAQFAAIYGPKAQTDRALFDAFYQNEFEGARAVCGFNPQAPDLIRALRQAGYRVVLATNPIFPAVATEARIRWAGLCPSDFELYTTYENIGYCKPNPAYYRELLSRLDAAAADCLMVGNDAHEDGAARLAGIDVFLLTDCLINKTHEDITAFPHGGFDQLRAYIKGNGLNKA